MIGLCPRVYLVGSGSGGLGLTDPFDCHVYLLDGGREVALIDAGIGSGAPRIVANAGEVVDTRAVTRILVTHAHPDHSGGCRAIRDLLDGARVAASPEVAGWVREGDERAMSIEMGKRAEFYPPDFTFDACPVDDELHDGDHITVGDLTLEVLDTPGHADGHISLLCPIEGRTILFCGDVVFFGGRISLENNWDCRIQEYAATMAKLASRVIDVLLPGHQALSLSDGGRHVQAAGRLFSRGFVPPSVV